MTTIEHFVGNETLVVERCWCGCLHAVPKTLHDMKRRAFDNGERYEGMHCPLGHTWVWSGETKVDRMEKAAQRAQELLESQRRATEHETARRQAAERQVSAARGQVTKIKNRVKNGVCPCCNRTFGNLARHMASQHPDFVEPTK
jgi:hypothetical protein